MLRRLLDGGTADVEARHCGVPPLLYAARRTALELVRVLLHAENIGSTDGMNERQSCASWGWNPRAMLGMEPSANAGGCNN